jgi:acetyltransferase-like isoleucine patch superfamily enzyme
VSPLRWIFAARDRARLALWLARLRLRLRRAGARLVVDAPHGLLLAGTPRLELTDWGGSGDAMLTLRVGRDVRIGRDLVLEVQSTGTNTIELGDGCTLADHVRLQVRSGAVRMGPRARIRSFVVLKSEGELVLGGDNEISYGTVIHCARRIEIGERTGIAEHCSIVDSDHTADGSDTHFYNQPLRYGDVWIDSNVFVAAGVTVTRGTRIGRNSVVAAGAVVIGADVPPSSLVAGAPARVVRELQPASSP